MFNRFIIGFIIILSICICFCFYKIQEQDNKIIILTDNVENLIEDINNNIIDNIPSKIKNDTQEV